jgi:hypothetical protein
MVVCKEMQKLREWLDQHNIPWEDCSEEFEVRCKIPFYICRTHFRVHNHLVSVINGHGTYGGYSVFEHSNKGLLEVMSGMLNDGEPIGFLTADELIKILQDQCHLEGAKEDIAITLMNEIAGD